jgi:hypothetical protein
MTASDSVLAEAGSSEDPEMGSSGGGALDPAEAEGPVTEAEAPGGDEAPGEAAAPGEGEAPEGEAPDEDVGSGEGESEAPPAEQGSPTGGAGASTEEGGLSEAEPGGGLTGAGEAKGQPGSESTASSTTEPVAPFRFFASTSFWNEPIAATAALDPTSSAAIEAFDAEVAREQETRHGPWINTTTYSVPIYTVPADQPTVKVALASNSIAPALQSAWDAVPLPAGAKPSAGTDKALVLWQPSTNRLWEFWRLWDGTSGWQAAWGGAMQKVSTNPGVYSPEAWPGAKYFWGSSASSMSIAGGLITLEDLRHGQINHALAMAIPGVRAGFYAAPAERDDGKSTDPLSLPEGAHLRLDPKLDLAALHLPHLTLMIAEAAQRYGIFVRDRGGNVCFFAQDPVPTGKEPYRGPGGFFEGQYPSQLLAAFPWSHLQLLKLELHAQPGS